MLIGIYYSQWYSLFLLLVLAVDVNKGRKDAKLFVENEEKPMKNEIDEKLAKFASNA